MAALIDGGRSLACLRIVPARNLGVALPLSSLDGGFVPHPGASPGALADALADRTLRWLTLLPLCDRRFAHAVLRRLPHAIVRPHDESPYVPAQSATTWLASRGKNLRSTTKSGRRRLLRDGGEVIRLQAGELTKHWSNLADVERHGHRRRGRVMTRPVVRNAFLALDRDRRVEVWVVRLRDQFAAYVLTCVSQSSTYVYTTAMRQDASPYSPGNVLFEAAIVEGLSQGRSVNLGPGRSQFKARFTSSSTPLDDVLLLPRAVQRVSPLLRAATRHKLVRRCAG